MLEHVTDFLHDTKKPNTTVQKYVTILNDKELKVKLAKAVIFMTLFKAEYIEA